MILSYHIIVIVLFSTLLLSKNHQLKWFYTSRVLKIGICYKNQAAQWFSMVEHVFGRLVYAISFSHPFSQKNRINEVREIRTIFENNNELSLMVVQVQQQCFRLSEPCEYVPVLIYPPTVQLNSLHILRKDIFFFKLYTV